jgi:glycerol-3-phosphate dehydrogenase subunit B
VKLAVIGGGVAGTAAAWAARRAFADVTAIFDRAGASALYSGALDDAPWDEAFADTALDSELLAFSVALEAWSVGTRSARVATHDGVLRPARGRDSSLLDLAALSGARVAIAATRVDGWDAGSLARSLSSSPWAVRTRTRFDAVPVSGVFDPGEVSASPYDLAALHDEPSRMARLAECLRQSSVAPDAWLLGPWLGAAPGGADALSTALGKPCGETTSPPGGPAGARFDASRDALLANVGVQLRHERVRSIETRGRRFLVAGSGGGLTANDAGFDAIILAIGGVAGGGIQLRDALDDEDAVAVAAGIVQHGAFRPSVRAPVVIGLSGRALERASSERGFDVAAMGIGALERVGILTDGAVARGASGVFAAGDSVADLPRTTLAAARSGIVAARAAIAAGGGAEARPRALP